MTYIVPAPTAEEIDATRRMILEAFNVTEEEEAALDAIVGPAERAAAAEFEFFRDVVIPYRVAKYIETSAEMFHFPNMRGYSIQLGIVPCPGPPDCLLQNWAHEHERRRSQERPGVYPHIEEIIHGR